MLNLAELLGFFLLPPFFHFLLLLLLFLFHYFNPDHQIKHFTDIALRPDLQALRKIVYFHENQITYPCRDEKERDIQFSYVQMVF